MPHQTWRREASKLSLVPFSGSRWGGRQWGAGAGDPQAGAGKGSREAGNGSVHRPALSVWSLRRTNTSCPVTVVYMPRSCLAWAGPGARRFLGLPPVAGRAPRTGWWGGPRTSPGREPGRDSDCPEHGSQDVEGHERSSSTDAQSGGSQRRSNGLPTQFFRIQIVFLPLSAGNSAGVFRAQGQGQGRSSSPSDGWGLAGDSRRSGPGLRNLSAASLSGADLICPRPPG